MPITYTEKNQFSRNAHDIAIELALKLSNFDNSVLLFKVLAHAVKNNDSILRALDETVFENPNLFSEQFSQLLLHALTQATSSVDYTPSVAIAMKEYTPNELAKYFGVSGTTIHNWLVQKRFEGLDKVGGLKHNRIPEDTVYITPSGKRMLVKEVVEMWYMQEAEHASTVVEDDFTYYTRQIARYEQKYKGEFEQTLGAKGKLTPEEETDAQVWKYLLRRQELGFRDTEE